MRTSIFIASATALACTMVSSIADEKSTAWRVPQKKENFHIFILMGQSNMSGYGQMKPEDKKPVPHILNMPTKGAKKWQPAAHPLHNRLGSDRFGLALPFAKAYLKSNKGITVGLISVAWGGAGIDRLKKGTPVYADALEKIRLAQKQGTIKGVLWHQGESDTINPKLASTYQNKLQQLVKDIRTDTGNPKLPFIVGNLAEFYGTGKDHRAPQRVKQIDQVRNALRNLPKHVKYTAFAESTGCSSPDHHMVHFDRKSYIILGKRYEEALKKLNSSL